MQQGVQWLSDFYEFTQNDVFFVTRLKSNAVNESATENEIPSYIDNGVNKDEIIRVDIMTAYTWRQHN